jgi:hypothetical protein
VHNAIPQAGHFGSWNMRLILFESRRQLANGFSDNLQVTHNRIHCLLIGKKRFPTHAPDISLNFVE